MPTPGEQLGEIKEQLSSAQQWLQRVVTEAPLSGAQQWLARVQQAPQQGDTFKKPESQSTGTQQWLAKLQQAPQETSAQQWLKKLQQAPQTPDAVPPPLPKKYPAMPKEQEGPPDLPEWHKSVRDQKRKDKREGSSWAEFLTTPIKEMYDYETPDEKKKWKKQEEAAGKKGEQDRWKQAADSYNSAMGQKQPGEMPSMPRGSGGMGGGKDNSEEILDVLEEIRDLVKQIKDKPAAQCDQSGSPGFKTVYKAPPNVNRVQKSDGAGGPKTKGATGDSTKQWLAKLRGAPQAGEAAGGAEGIGALLAGS
jgi:hypothetical protein